MLKGGTIFSPDMEIPKDVTEYVRVLKLASFPDTEEFLRVATIAGVGVALVGAIGFVVYVLMQPIPT